AAALPRAGASPGKRKRVNLSVKQKLELIEKLESGWSVARACEEYGVKKQTVSDIRKAKEKLKRFVLMFVLQRGGWDELAVASCPIPSAPARGRLQLEPHTWKCAHTHTRAYTTTPLS
uniref:HTH psq-type domain-containing protein n=1 Tax=Naja naja TaxID=35670 RepID=A0A8C6X7W9_NAJNA